MTGNRRNEFFLSEYNLHFNTWHQFLKYFAKSVTCYEAILHREEEENPFRKHIMR